MNMHYYSHKPQAESRRATVTYRLPNATNESFANIVFITDSGVFSKSRVDFGTDLLIRSLPPLNGRALDLGCGYGAAGISLALLNPGVDMWFSDINERAVELCRENYARIAAPPLLSSTDVVSAPVEKRVRCSDGFAEFVDEEFDIIIINPPVRAGKARIFQLYEEARDRLKGGGALYVVIQKKQGMQSTYKELAALFGNCEDIARKAGYHVLRATK